jgi:hypothetical protein
LQDDCLIPPDLHRAVFCANACGKERSNLCRVGQVPDEQWIIASTVCGRKFLLCTILRH